MSRNDLISLISSKIAVYVHKRSHLLVRVCVNSCMLTLPVEADREVVKKGIGRAGPLLVLYYTTNGGLHIVPVKV